MPPEIRRPNVLFLMTDQQRFDALSCRDGWIRTPHLDGLAREGVDLRGHFSQAPVCVPSRCSLFSGQYPHTHGVLENDRRLPEGTPHLFGLLRGAGYWLSYAGKNHLLPEPEMEAAFDHYDSRLLEESTTGERRAYVQLEAKALDRLNTVGCHTSGEFHDLPDHATTTGLVAESAIESIQAAPSNRPWCAVASFFDPHVPHLAPRRFASAYPMDAMVVPAWYPEQLTGEPPRVRIKREAQKAGLATDEDRRRYLSVYGAMCSFADEQIGRILRVLATRPDAGRTMVVFVSDHGDFCWHHGMCKKDLVLYDDLLRVPAIFHWRGRLAPRVVADTLTEHVDVVPTLLEFAGIDPPAGCQGRSMAGLLTGEVDRHRDEIHAEVCYPGMRNPYASEAEHRRAWDAAFGTDTALGRSASYNLPGDHTKCVRTKEWKYIWFGDGFEELYDLQRDPGERRNLALHPSWLATKMEMRGRLAAWLEPQVGTAAGPEGLEGKR